METEPGGGRFPRLLRTSRYGDRDSRNRTGFGRVAPSEGESGRFGNVQVRPKLENDVRKDPV